MSLIDRLKTWALAAVAAGAFGSAASAATVAFNPDNNVAPGGGPYNVLLGPYDFGVQFDIDAGETIAGGIYDFTFFNNSTTAAALTFTDVTINQGSAEFLGGVKLTFGSFSQTTNQDVTTGYNFSILIAANTSETLFIDFGNVIDNAAGGGGSTDIDFTVEASVVPLPAGGLLLISALGGLAFLRRRKAASA